MADPSTRTLVYGATGAQGGAVLRALLQRGHPATGLARDEAEADALRAAGAEAALADFDDADSLRRASDGVGRVFLSVPLGLPTATVREYGRRAIDAAREGGVGLVVFNTSTRIPEAPTAVDAFEEKREVERALFESGVPAVSLRPTFYYGNFAGPWTAPGIVREGTVAYPVPADVEASWLSWEDAASFAVAALARPALAGQAIDIGGPEVLDGPAVAERFTRALGCEIGYVHVPADAFEKGLAEALGPEAARSVAAMYRWMAEDGGDGLFTADADALRETFGVGRLLRLQEWVERQDWEALASPARTG